MKGQQAVNDSIKAFIAEYNKTRGYDAILIKNATLYINPALDITDEVVEGLNARYNKVKK
jgi:outer membrane protein